MAYSIFTYNNALKEFKHVGTTIADSADEAVEKWIKKNKKKLPTNVRFFARPPICS
tara:strand:- start:3676 stop:3843 length:168 start_codon:yes stop_codon:yes gene_type:complete